MNHLDCPCVYYHSDVVVRQTKRSFCSHPFFFLFVLAYNYLLSLCIVEEERRKDEKNE